MQLPILRTAAIVGMAAIVSLATAACSKDSNSVTGPAVSASPAANVSGSWSGSFVSGSALCSSVAVTATLQQNGAELTGYLDAPACDVAGSFRGTLAGTHVSGYFNMPGCVGGSAAGQVDGSSMSLTIDDLRKPLVTGDRIILPGGTLTLHRQG
jgi:hypothetical protein